MTKRIALGWMAVSLPLLLLCMLIDRPAAVWVFSFVVATQPAALMAIGVSQDGRPGALRSVVWGLAALMTLVAILLLSIPVESGWTVWGFPVSSLLALGGFWLLPLILTTAAYAATFSRFGLRKEDLEAIRRLRRE